MTKIVRDLSTPENQAYWKGVEDAASKVSCWPDWKRAGINVAQIRSQPRSIPEVHSVDSSEIKVTDKV